MEIIIFLLVVLIFVIGNKMTKKISQGQKLLLSIIAGSALIFWVTISGENATNYIKVIIITVVLSYVWSNYKNYKSSKPEINDVSDSLK